MHGALDDVVFEHAVGEAGRAVRALVVGGVERAADVVDGEHVVADLEALNGILRNVRGGAQANESVRHDLLRYPCEMNLVLK